MVSPGQPLDEGRARHKAKRKEREAAASAELDAMKAEEPKAEKPEAPEQEPGKPVPAEAGRIAERHAEKEKRLQKADDRKSGKKPEEPKAE